PALRPARALLVCGNRAPRCSEARLVQSSGASRRSAVRSATALRTRCRGRVLASALAGTVIYSGSPHQARVGWLEWGVIYLWTGPVRGAGHNFGILIHTLRFPNGDERKLSISVTDTSTGWYRTYTALIPKDRYTWSRKSLHIRMPGLTWTGSARQMRVKTKTPW